MSQEDPSEAAARKLGLELAEDSLSAVTYESDTETKLKKKTSHKLPKSPESPYTSSTCLHPRKAGFLKSFRAMESKRFEIPLVKASRQLWRGSLKQGAWVGPLKSDLDIDPGGSLLSSSTPEYLKEALGMKKPKHARSASSGYIPGTPNYKEKEDMYDEIIELKKTVQTQKCETDRMKTKLRRLEEDNSRKDRQIEQLLEAAKMISGLKQKILRLEQQCKEKDNTINKLQTDVKSTNAEEMRIALQAYYEEIQRLQTLLAKSKTVQRKYYRQQVKDSEEEENAGGSEGEDRKGRCGQQKTEGLWCSRSSSESKQLRVLNAAILQLSRNLKELQEENHSLKAHLDLILSTSPASSKVKNCTERSRQRLAQRISKLGKRADEKTRLQLSETSASPLLTPSTPAQLDQPTAKESDSSEECEHLRRVVKKLKGQRAVLQNQLAVKEGEIQKLTEQVKELEENQGSSCLDSTASPDQGQQESRPGSQQSLLNGLLNSKDSHLGPSPLGFAKHHRHEQAARIIQRQWKAYKTKIGEEELNKVAVVLQAAFRGHLARQKLLASNAQGRNSPSMSNVENKNPEASCGPSSSQMAADCKADEEAVKLLQSAFRAHVARTGLVERPLDFSPEREEVSPAASNREKKPVWSTFKYAPLVFTLGAPAPSSQDQPQPSLSLSADEAHSDDSDDIITVSPAAAKSRSPFDFRSGTAHSLLRS
ncbi:IQ domain-containing protein E isoform X2 [Hemicordylus capensis]|uniref:IQ domain-containing protein E isoform X2 n=1 Tax=Hemicordylus capensis TaxID=884348 RepID=UPI0023038B44|nr:IQ domain-containing protein E isoform X2 [Hemicordylus capensis]